MLWCVCLCDNSAFSSIYSWPYVHCANDIGGKKFIQLTFGRWKISAFDDSQFLKLECDLSFGLYFQFSHNNVRLWLALRDHWDEISTLNILHHEFNLNTPNTVDIAKLCSNLLKLATLGLYIDHVHVEKYYPWVTIFSS